LSYRKGVAAEQQLIRMLKDRGYETQRAAGSRGAADIVAGKKALMGLSKKRFAIQVKSTSNDQYRTPKEAVKKLIEFANKLDQEPILAVRFSAEKWRFWTGEEEELEFFDKPPLKALLDGKESYTILDVNDKRAQLFEKTF